MAGILLFGKDPQAFLPQSGVTCVRFAGKEPQAGYAAGVRGALARIIEMLAGAAGQAARGGSGHAPG